RYETLQCYIDALKHTPQTNYGDRPRNPFQHTLMRYENPWSSRPVTASARSEITGPALAVQTAPDHRHHNGVDPWSAGPAHHPDKRNGSHAQPNALPVSPDYSHGMPDYREPNAHPPRRRCDAAAIALKTLR